MTFSRPALRLSRMSRAGTGSADPGRDPFRRTLDLANRLGCTPAYGILSPLSTCGPVQARGVEWGAFSPVPAIIPPSPTLGSRGDLGARLGRGFSLWR